MTRVTPTRPPPFGKLRGIAGSLDRGWSPGTRTSPGARCAPGEVAGHRQQQPRTPRTIAVRGVHHSGSVDQVLNGLSLALRSVPRVATCSRTPTRRVVETEPPSPIFWFTYPSAIAVPLL